MSLIFLVHFAATLFMVGVIWFVQVVHYPLFEQVNADNFAEYEDRHRRLTIMVVMPPMLVEAATAGLLVWLRPEGVSSFQVWLGLGLVLLIWLSTAFLQIPQHGILSRGFDPGAYRSLVKSNWLRTLAWSGRGVLVLWMMAGVAGKFY
jgi:uncharacterized membrane protein